MKQTKKPTKAVLPFVRVPAWMIDSPVFSALDRNFYISVQRYQGQNEACIASMDTIARAARMNAKYAAKVQARFKAVGLLKIKNSGCGKPAQRAMQDLCTLDESESKRVLSEWEQLEPFPPKRTRNHSDKERRSPAEHLSRGKNHAPDTERRSPQSRYEVDPNTISWAQAVSAYGNQLEAMKWEFPDSYQWTKRESLLRGNKSVGKKETGTVTINSTGERPSDRLDFPRLPYRFGNGTI